MLIHAVPAEMVYDGSQLRSHFAFDTFGIQGDSLVWFLGGMDILPQNIADLADLRAGAAIRGSRLVHVIVEHFGMALETAILRQRLLVRLAADLVRGAAGPGRGAGLAKQLRVQGDDIFVGGEAAPSGKRGGVEQPSRGGKLSVSIAAPSRVSCLIHLGLNVSTAGVPVEAAGLEELGVDPAALAGDLARAYAAEIESIRLAAAKVRGVE